jgi:hypothetical protein
VQVCEPFVPAVKVERGDGLFNTTPMIDLDISGKTPELGPAPNGGLNPNKSRAVISVEESLPAER